MNDYFRQSRFAGYGLAVLTVTLAALARVRLEPLLGLHLTHLTFLLAVIITATLAGWKPAVLAMVLGAFGANYVFTLPHPDLATASSAHSIGRVGYFIVSGAIISLSHAQWTTQVRAETRLAVFSRLGELLSAAIKPVAAGRIISEAAEELLGWEAFKLNLYSLEHSPAGHLLEIRVINGEKIEVQHGPSSSDVPPLLKHVVKNGGELIMMDDHAAPLFPKWPRGLASRPQASMMLVPVRDQAATIGVLSIQSGKSNIYHPEDLRTLQALADYCGGALQRIRAEEALQRRDQEVHLLTTQLEQRVKERTAQLVSSNHELEAFCHSVSHDLRRPLRSISGFAQLLNEDYADHLDDSGRDFLKRLIQSSHEMGVLIEDLLHLSRLTRTSLRRDAVDLSTLAGSIASELRRTEPGRQVEFAIAPRLVGSVDERFMRIALENLLSNAWKFTGKQPAARIEFGLEPQPEGPAYFVRDNGAGFDMAYSGKLFEAFQRLHCSTEFPGHGIGLATVQRIINRHGGRIWAVGEVGRGATFYFTLPV